MGLLAIPHSTCVQLEHARQMPDEFRWVGIHIKDKIEKLEAEHRRQNTIFEEQTINNILGEHCNMK
jgi:hypothetical protein